MNDDNREPKEEELGAELRERLLSAIRRRKMLHNLVLITIACAVLCTLLGSLLVLIIDFFAGDAVTLATFVGVAIGSIISTAVFACIEYRWRKLSDK